MKKFFAAALAAVVLLVGCAKQPKKTEKFMTSFSDVFNTVTVVTAYCESEADFDRYAGIIHDEMLRLHRLFDIYNDYEGINNLKTVNDMAGIAPVVCEPEIIQLLTEGAAAYELSEGTVNIAMGNVLRLWHEAREAGLASPEEAALPDPEALKEAALHADVTKVLIDAEKGEVYLTDSEMSLDVGAFAKGWATERAAQAVREAGLKSCILSAGGNVVTIGAPGDGRPQWGVGIRNPDGGDLIATVSASDLSVVTSGDYERFYVVEGRRYHHIIDPETLFPAVKFRSVTILHKDSGMADILSTALFVLPQEEGAALAARYSAEAMWIDADGSIEATEGLRSRLANLIG